MKELNSNVYIISKSISGRGKILFYKEGDREKMEKKYPDIEFNKMNQLTFITTYKGGGNYDLVIQIGNTNIQCSFKKWSEPWLYDTKLELRIHFKDLKKKSVIHITGGIQKKLFQFFRYDYEKMQDKKKTKRGGCSSRGGGKKRTVRKSKSKGNKNSAYFEFKKGSSRKFWRITKKGTKIITQFGRLMSLGQMTTKDYGSKVDQEYDKLIQSKKKKGYVEKWDFGSPNPKKPTAIEREYMKICNKAERSKVLNPNQINSDCEAMLDQGESELKWMIGWYKDALKKGEYDWDKYTEHNKSRRKK